VKLNTDLIGIRIQLTRWGRLCRALGIGYPNMATMERARIGRGGLIDGPTLPPDLAEIDYEVTVLEPDYRIILVEHYTKSGGWREHSFRLGLCKSDYYDRKESAETCLNTSLKLRNRFQMLRAS
jgi:hypothetical protein